MAYGISDFKNFIKRVLKICDNPVYYHITSSSSTAGEWKEALCQEVSVSLSQNIPLGGWVAVKNIPVDHLSNRKLQVSENSVVLGIL